MTAGPTDGADPIQCAIEGEREAERIIGLVKSDIAGPDAFYTAAAQVHDTLGNIGLRAFMRALQKRAERRGSRRSSNEEA